MTGIAPAELLADDLLLAAAADEAKAATWTDLHELLAINTEVTHAVLRQSMAAAGAKDMDLPPPLRIPRPHDKPKTVRPLDMARMFR